LNVLYGRAVGGISRAEPLASLNAQFMAPARIELSQCFALLAELAPPPRQLLGGENRDREVTPVADGIVFGVIQCPACNHAALSGVSTPKRFDCTAFCARVTAASRFLASSSMNDRTPSRFVRCLFIGATTRFTSTSNSRAGPSSPVSHLSSALIPAVCGSHR